VEGNRDGMGRWLLIREDGSQLAENRHECELASSSGFDS